MQVLRCTIFTLKVAYSCTACYTNKLWKYFHTGAIPFSHAPVTWLIKKVRLKCFGTLDMLNEKLCWLGEILHYVTMEIN